MVKRLLLSANKRLVIERLQNAEPMAKAIGPHFFFQKVSLETESPDEL